MVTLEKKMSLALKLFPIIFLTQFIIDDLVKSLKSVTPAEAGVQKSLNLLDSRFRGNDKKGEIETFYETVMIDSSLILFGSFLLSGSIPTRCAFPISSHQ
jgi:hypothetical protein